MAHIVAGFASSFSPQLHVPVEMWADMGKRDAGGRNLIGADGKSHSYDELLEMADPSVAKAAQPEEQAKRHKACQDNIAVVGKKMQETDLDALVYFADDEHSLFDVDNWPAVLCFYGPEVPYRARTVAENAPPQTRAAAWAYGTESLDLPGAPELGERILYHLTANDIEVSRATKLLEGKGIGHHLGFMNTRLLNGKQVPVIPFVINGSYPPNTPSPRRLYRMGQAINEAVESWGSDARVGVVAIGGFSHAVIDEEMDRRIFEACQRDDAGTLSSIPEERLQGGNGQTRIWFAAAGALKGLKMQPLDYIPAYRSAGGTGCGMGFAIWQ
jgi:hypothetical protein